MEIITAGAVLVLIFVVWQLHENFWPRKPCGRCNGTGKLRAPLSKAFRACPSCDGKGYKRRDI